MRSRTSSATASTSMPGKICLAIRSIGARFCRSARTAASIPGYWTLTRDLAPVVKARPVDLADRGGGHRHLVELREDALERLAQLTLDDAPHLGEADGGRRVAQRGERRADLLAVLRRDSLEVGDGQHLAGLHRRALHAAEDADDLLGRVDLAPAQRVVGLARRARQVDRPRARVLGGLGRREAPERRGPPQARGGDLVRRLVGHLDAAGGRQPPRWTCEPGTMSSRPSGQRTQALCPPS